MNKQQMTVAVEAQQDAAEWALISRAHRDAFDSGLTDGYRTMHERDAIRAQGKAARAAKLARECMGVE